MRGNICFDFFFSSYNHNIYILIASRLLSGPNHAQNRAVVLGQCITKNKSEPLIDFGVF